MPSRSLIETVSEMSGENVYSCYQCGECSASCPVADRVDVFPNQIMRLIQFGDEAVLDSKTIWLCASCLLCSQRCPRGIDIAKVIEALRQIILRRGVYKVDLNRVEGLEELPQIALVAAARKMTG